MRRRSWLLGLIFASCQYARPADIEPEVDAGIDAPPPECEAGIHTCVADLYTACDDSGRFVRYELPNGGVSGAASTVVMDGYPCPLGCHPTDGRCLEIAPSNGIDAPIGSRSAVDLDLTDTSGDVSFLTNSAITAGTVTVQEPNGTEHRVPAEVVAQAGGPEILVLRVRSFSLRAGVTFIPIGARALAIESDFDIYVAGTLAANWRGFAGLIPAPSGCWGGANSDASGGGGNVSLGGASSAGAAGGAAIDPSRIVSPLLAGCPGGVIGGQSGGMPGGALQLISGTRVHVDATGLVSVAGGGGRGFVSTADGRGKAAGGGAGGAVVIEAPTLLVTPGGTINGRGGSGGAASGTSGGTVASGKPGDDPSLDATVPGATCVGCGVGGNGGVEMSGPTAGTGGAPQLGGGGGSAGRMTLRLRQLGAFPPGSMRIPSIFQTVPTR